MSFIISRSGPRINLILGYNPKIFASATPAPSIGIREVLCESHSFLRYLIHSHQIHRKKKKKIETLFATPSHITTSTSTTTTKLSSHN